MAGQQVLLIIACLVLVLTLTDAKGYVNKRAVVSQCCECDDNDPDPTKQCSSSGICSQRFHLCTGYCHTRRHFDGLNWNVTRSCADEIQCIDDWYHIVATPACASNFSGDPALGTTCSTCCRAPNRITPTHCIDNIDTGFIRFNLTTIAPTTTALTTQNTPNVGWSDWLQWQQCSASCNGGLRIRIRICNNPVPSNGGSHCRGSSFEQESCNTQSCGSGAGIVG